MYEISYFISKDTLSKLNIDKPLLSYIYYFEIIGKHTMFNWFIYNELHINFKYEDII